MAEMIERVARALWDLHQSSGFVQNGSNWLLYGEAWGDKPVPWEYLTSDAVEPSVAEDYRIQARAAIEAMREPTDAMVQTACPSHVVGEPMAKNRGECPKHHNAKFRWRAMIDAALSGSHTPSPVGEGSHEAEPRRPTEQKPEPPRKGEA